MRVCKMGRLGALLLLSASLICSAQVPQTYTSHDRETALQILNIVEDHLRKDYYDPDFHGVDIDAVFADARAKIRTSTSYDKSIEIIAGTLDPLQDAHTFFLPPPTKGKFDYGFCLAFVGDKCFITKVRPGSDAELQGLKPGFQVLEINDQLVTRQAYWKLAYYFEVISPRTGLQLSLKKPDGEAFTTSVSTEREDLKNATPLYQRTVLEGMWGMARPVKFVEYGEDLLVVRLENFIQDPIELLRITYKVSKHKAVIFDLRGNPGGLVFDLKDLLNKLFDHNVLVGTEVQRKSKKQMAVKGSGKHAFGGNVFVLVDGESASASEIFARVVQLEKRGKIIGDRTQGFVMEAKFSPLTSSLPPDPGVEFGLSISVGDLLMSDGVSLEKIGVTPDEILLPTAQDIAAGRDPVLARAAELAGVKLTPEEAGKLFPYVWPKM